MTATITFAGRVSGIGHLDRHAPNSSFVSHERSQLPERPTSQNYPLRLPNLYPVENTAKFFDGDTPTSAFGCRNDLFGYAMVNVTSKTRFFARQFTKTTACRLRLKLLEFGSQSALPMPHGFDRLTAVVLSVRVAGDISNPEVDAKEIIGVSRFGLLNVTRGCQKPVAAMEEKIRFALAGCEQRQLPLSCDKVAFYAPVESAYGNCLLIDMPRQISVVECEATERLKSPLCFLVELICVRDLRCASDGHLGWNSEGLSQFSVREFLERVLGKRLLFPRLIAQPIAGFICRAQ
jgi:hypothetical protein